MADYHKMMNEWNFDNYVKELENADCLTDELRDKVKYLEEARKSGYDLVYLKLVSGHSISYENKNIKPLYHAEMFAYRTNSDENAYVNIDVVVAKPLGVNDSKSHEIHSTPEGHKFVIKRISASPFRFGELFVESPSI